jgi:hypothetical protein
MNVWSHRGRDPSLALRMTRRAVGMTRWAQGMTRMGGRDGKVYSLDGESEVWPRSFAGAQDDKKSSQDDKKPFRVISRWAEDTSLNGRRL